MIYLFARPMYVYIKKIRKKHMKQIISQEIEDTNCETHGRVILKLTNALRSFLFSLLISTGMDWFTDSSTGVSFSSFGFSVSLVP